MIEVENRSKELQRYYLKKTEINEKQKEYFRKIWYLKNRINILKYQQNKRDGYNPKGYNITTTPINEPLIIQKNIRVEF